MMKNKTIIILLTFFACILLGAIIRQRVKTETQTAKQVKETVKPLQRTAKITKSIFIPYWTSQSAFENLADYDRVIYFGITPSLDGIAKDETGYKRLSSFVKATEGKKRFLTLRMTNDNLNLKILENHKLQEKIIDEAIEIAEQNGFDGIVLDLEIFSLFNSDIDVQINNFVQLFYSTAKQNYRKLSLTLYGDTFYRKRPYDINFLAKNSDEIMIMAYDFHKSRGEPGPNFPLSGRDIYGYDLKTMLSDILKLVPQEKITVIFGMFGYDWLVDEKKRPVKQAKALTLNEVKKNFLEKCEFQNCVVKRDDLSKETEVNYIVSAQTPDEQGFYRIDYHIVWFEDQESVKAKTHYLKKKGISNVAFWAYSYF